MITYTISPTIKRFPYFQGDKNKKPSLPMVKEYLFFVTTDDYHNIKNKNIYSNKPSLFNLEIDDVSNKALIRANSVIEYECGITLNNTKEIKEFLDYLSIKGHYRKEQQYFGKKSKTLISYTSDYHLEHNYEAGKLNDEQKESLIQHGFPDCISIEEKEFVLHAIGINLSEDMFNQPLSNTKGRHIQIVYADVENNGYLKFRKPDNAQPSDPVSEISQCPEYDAIYVNIHFTKQPDSDFKKQLSNIGQNFKFVTTHQGSAPKIPGYKDQTIKNYFGNLQKQFKSLYKIAFDTDYDTCQTLYNLTNQRYHTTVNNKPVKEKTVEFNSNLTIDFISLKIFNDSKLTAPENLKNLLLELDLVPSIAADEPKLEPTLLESTLEESEVEGITNCVSTLNIDNREDFPVVEELGAVNDALQVTDITSLIGLNLISYYNHFN